MSGDQSHNGAPYFQPPSQLSNREQYSTLEVAPNSNWRASENAHPAPQVDFGTCSPEVVPSHSAPEAVYPSDLPAYSDNKGLSTGGVAVASDNLNPTKPEQRILGIRRRTFFIILGILVALIVIGVGVGVGVALGTKLTSTSSPSTTDEANILNDPIDNSDVDIAPANSTDPLAISANTKLAATNITDAYGHDNFFLFWQLNNGAIHMGSFNRSSGKWNETALTTYLDIDPADIMPGTSISASGAYKTATTFDLHLCWLSATSKVVCWLWRPVSTIRADMPGKWTRSSLSDFYTARNGSGLATYSRFCMFCSPTPYVFWQGETHIEGTYHDGKEWKSLSGITESDSIPAKPGTPLAMLPVGISGNVSSLNMFFVSASSIPTTVSNVPAVDGDPTKWHRETLSGELVVDEPLSIAAFSTSKQDVENTGTGGSSGSSSAGESGMVDAQVVIALREKGQRDARIGLQYYSKGSWKAQQGNNGIVGDLGECAEMGVLTANQAGRVFCVVRIKPTAEFGEEEAKKGGVKIVGFKGSSQVGKFKRQGTIVPRS